MRTFRVKNLEKYQHYKDRRPPWIKLHAELLEDYDFARLQDASKLHLVLIWLLASRYEDALPWDSEWLSRRMNATETIDLDALKDAGFIIEIQEDNEKGQDASDMLASCTQSATPENREQRTENKDSPPVSPTKKLTFKQAVEGGDLESVCFGKVRRLFTEKGWPQIGLDLLWDEFRSFWRDERPRTKKADWPRAFYNRAVERRTWRAYQIEGTQGNGISPETESERSAERIAGALEILRQRDQEDIPGSA